MGNFSRNPPKEANFSPLKKQGILRNIHSFGHSPLHTVMENMKPLLNLAGSYFVLGSLN